MLNWFKQKKLEKEKALRAKFLQEEEDNRNRILQEELTKKLNSSTPWFEIINDVDDDLPTRERYRWNSAFITKIRADGITGKHDVDVIDNWLEEQETVRRAKILTEERQKRRESSEPWVEVIGEELDAENNIKLSLDWNKPFINVLKRNGFTGASEDDMIESWLMSLHTEILANESEFDS